MPLEFFHDILDEHFTETEVVNQLETALNWGRYAEIFSYDPEDDNLRLLPTTASTARTRDRIEHMSGPTDDRTMKRPAQRDPAKTLAWGTFPHGVPSLLKDLPIFLAAFSVFYAFLAVARYWLTPVNSQAEIDLRPSALPAYAMFSVMRIAIAYVISLIFSIAYGYVAAYNAKAERVMIPLLDTLQSIPVLSFLPGVMLAMVALFPRRQFGIELGSILLIFSGQAWNMAFSFYSSLKSIPQRNARGRGGLSLESVAKARCKWSCRFPPSDWSGIR